MTRGRRTLVAAASVAAALVAALGAATFATSCGDAPPRGVFDRVAHDFGAARQDTTVRTSFRLENAGGRTLRVTSVKGDCSCETAKASADAIAPGDHATIDVAFHTGTFAGRTAKHVKVVTDDPERRETTLTLEIDVSAGIVVQPSLFGFAMTLAGGTPEAALRLQWKECVGRPFRVTGVEVPGLDVATDVQPFDEPPWHGMRVSLRFRSAPPIGPISARAVIRTDDPDVPRIEVPVGGIVTGKVVFPVRVATLGVVRPGKAATARLPFHPFDDAVSIGAATATAKSGRVVATAVRDVAKPREWWLEVRLAEGAKPGPIDEVIEVTTDVPDEGPIEVRVVGTVLGK